ncbi:hypothetical protein ACL9RL_04500 [Plantibacter sp. Mn2098]|uniref:hypothetical protein n=1 Tax=Plantibacter sp. Mn2098 TaxID=3395266 RepID=UPI003BDB32F0
MNGLWWLPSFVVFGGAAVLVWLVVSVLRGRRKAQRTSGASIDDLHRRAGIALVRTDDLIREAADEVDFAEAEFGRDVARGYGEAVQTARASLQEAFRLRQALEDEIPDTEIQRRQWNERITHICGEVEKTLAEHLRALTDRRGVERSAPERVTELRTRLDDARSRLTATGLTLANLASSIAATALADAGAVRRQAQESADAAAADLDRATERVAANLPTADPLDRAGRALQQATARLDAVDRSLAGITAAAAQVEPLREQTRRALADAAILRDTALRPETVTIIARTIEQVGRTVAETGMRAIDSSASSIGSATGAAAQPSTLPDPVAQLDRLRTANTELDAALATARSAQQRLANATEALSGALFTAQSHLRVAGDYIAANRSRVGADARTRLAEATRQLELATAASTDDPVEALDIARRASRIAQDADALARYDTGPHPAPFAD